MAVGVTVPLLQRLVDKIQRKYPNAVILVALYLPDNYGSKTWDERTKTIRKAIIEERKIAAVGVEFEVQDNMVKHVNRSYHTS